jgi:hypothetical protein
MALLKYVLAYLVAYFVVVMIFSLLAGHLDLWRPLVVLLAAAAFQLLIRVVVPRFEDRKANYYGPKGARIAERLKRQFRRRK